MIPVMCNFIVTVKLVIQVYKIVSSLFVTISSSDTLSVQKVVYLAIFLTWFLQVKGVLTRPD